MMAIDFEFNLSSILAILVVILISIFLISSAMGNAWFKIKTSFNPEKENMYDVTCFVALEQEVFGESKIYRGNTKEGISPHCYFTNSRLFSLSPKPFSFWREQEVFVKMSVDNKEVKEYTIVKGVLDLDQFNPIYPKIKNLNEGQKSVLIELYTLDGKFLDSEQINLYVGDN